MTELFTASYSRWRPELGQPVRASLGVPRWIPDAKTWPRCWAITPRYSYWRSPDWEDQYVAQLRRYGAAHIARELETIAREHQAERILIMCFEVSPADCHRGAFAAFWLAETGELITEITPVETV